MKTLKIKPEAFQIDELATKVREHFGSRYNVTNNKHEIIIANTTSNKSIGCKLVLTKKRLMIHGTFPTLGRLLLAVCILIVGGVIIPMLVYMVAFKGKFEAIEKEVEDYIKSEFSDRLI
ncbi:MAG TPA: hypothetical protein VK623_05305 [Flavobacterium sp.]|nr:hypothetical protein [Flavobacterium sp.]